MTEKKKPNWLVQAFTSPEKRAEDEKKAHIARLSQTKDVVLSGANQLTDAHNSLTGTVDEIKQSIQAVQNQDTAALKEAIDTKYDLDQAYLDDLKAEVDRTQENTLSELKPLLVMGEKLRANILVSQNKASHYALVIRAKAEVYSSGYIQSDKLKELIGEGDEITEDMKTLLSDVEKLNNIGSATVAGVKSATSSNPFDLLQKDFVSSSILKDVSPTKSAG